MLQRKEPVAGLGEYSAGLPLGIGHIRTRTHDYIRHGTVTLFAALNYLDGKVLITTASPAHPCRGVDPPQKNASADPKELDLNLIVDNYSTHKHPVMKAWVERNPRTHLHFTPTGSSWLNLVEQFFHQLNDDVVREGSFTSGAELITAIEVHLAHHNLQPTPYRWKAQGAAILAKIARAREAEAKSRL